jgi:hypothetical protein
MRDGCLSAARIAYCFRETPARNGDANPILTRVDVLFMFRAFGAGSNRTGHRSPSADFPSVRAHLGSPSLKAGNEWMNAAATVNNGRFTVAAQQRDRRALQDSALAEQGFDKSASVMKGRAAAPISIATADHLL